LGDSRERGGAPAHRADQAFDRLRGANQRHHRELRDIADEVIRTGQPRGLS
jgi:hypothetical protein